MRSLLPAGHMYPLSRELCAYPVAPNPRVGKDPKDEKDLNDKKDGRLVRGLWREWRPACLDQTHARKAPGSAYFWCNLVDEQIGTISYARIWGDGSGWCEWTRLGTSVQNRATRAMAYSDVSCPFPCSSERSVVENRTDNSMNHGTPGAAFGRNHSLGFSGSGFRV